MCYRDDLSRDIPWCYRIDIGWDVSGVIFARMFQDVTGMILAQKFRDVTGMILAGMLQGWSWQRCFRDYLAWNSTKVLKKYNCMQKWLMWQLLPKTTRLRTLVCLCPLSQNWPQSWGHRSNKLKSVKRTVSETVRLRNKLFSIGASSWAPLPKIVLSMSLGSVFATCFI